MATFTPISNDFIQYQAQASGTSAAGYFLKLYASGTTIPISVALDSAGSVLVAKVELDSLGFAQNGSGGSTTLYIDQTYRLVLYVNATDADANTFANAVQDIDVIPQIATGDSDLFIKFTDLSASNGASLIGYDEGSLGSIATTIEAELKKSFFLTNYDTLQSALTAAAGEILYIDRNITIAPNVTSTASDGTTVIGLQGFTIDSSATVSDLYEVIRSGDNCTFTNIAFNGTVADAAGYCAIEVQGNSNVTIQGCLVNGHGEAFLLEDSNNIRVLNNTIIRTERFSISCAKLNDSLIAYNFVKDCNNSDGIKFRDKLYADSVTEYESSRNIITYNRCFNNDQDGIDFTTGGNSNIISYNLCNNNGVHGIQSKPNTATETLSQHTIQGNTCTGNGTSGTGGGIRAAVIRDSKISNNMISQNAEQGIQVSSSSDGPTTQVDITDNHIDSNTKNGIRLISDSVNRMTDIHVDGNLCVDNGNAVDNGIQWDGFSDRLIITNNRCYQRVSTRTNSGIHCVGTSSISAILIANNYCPQDLLDNTSEVPISMGAYSGDGVICKNNVTDSSGVYAFTDGDVTPSVAGANEIYVTTNTSPTNITSFDKHSFETSKFTVHVNDANTTLVHGSLLKLNGSVNFAPAMGSMVTFIIRNNVVYEVSRMTA